MDSKRIEEINERLKLGGNVKTDDIPIPYRELWFDCVWLLNALEEAKDMIGKLDWLRGEHEDKIRFLHGDVLDLSAERDELKRQLKETESKCGGLLMDAMQREKEQMKRAEKAEDELDDAIERAESAESKLKAYECAINETRMSFCKNYRGRQGIETGCYNENPRSVNCRDCKSWLFDAGKYTHIEHVTSKLESADTATRTEELHPSNGWTSTTHELKCTDKYYDAIARKNKMFEVRYNDRNYCIGDILLLRRTDANGYTGQTSEYIVTYLLDDPAFCKEGFVIMGIEPFGEESQESKSGLSNRKLTKEEYENPDTIKYTNSEIPATDVVFGDRLEELVDKYATVAEEPQDVDKLKDCPFCGGKAFINTIEAHAHHLAKFMPDYEGEAFVECTKCSCGISERTEDEAIDAWNRRAQDVDVPEQECEKCKAYERAIKSYKNLACLFCEGADNCKYIKGERVKWCFRFDFDRFKEDSK